MKPTVSVNYFSGWWPEGSCKWLDPLDGHDWRPEHVSRIPLHGFYNSQETTDRDILAASAHGVDYFQMLWYPVDSPDTDVDEPHRKHLNEGITFFMNSPHADKMKFMVEYCNHPPFAITKPDEWEKTCRLWAEMLAHSSYIRVFDRPLFKIHGMQYFFMQCGSDFTVMGQRLAVLKNAIYEKLGVMPILSAGITVETPEYLKPFTEYFDYFSTYMDVPGDEPVDTDYPYQTLVDFAIQAATRLGAAGIPYQPYLPVGWNPRPWHDPRPCYAIPSGEELENAVRRLVELMDTLPSLGITCENKTCPAFSMYAWNEFGEGGYLAPTLIEGDQKLKGLASALNVAKNA